MEAAVSPELGVLFHAIGGLAAGSFYIPFKKVKGWSWETYWLIAGIASWIIAPLVGAYFTVPDFTGVLSAAPSSSLFYCFLFGALWGVGGLTFGLSMRYLGMSLGYALALGACAAFGTLIPPMFEAGKFAGMFQSASGLVVMAGVVVCLLGIGVCGLAGMRKERELSTAEKQAVITEFNFRKGVLVALFAGIMSACMAFAIAAGKPIAEAAVAAGARPVFANNVVFVVIMLGGFATNLAWCVYQHARNNTGGEYLSGGAPKLLNLLLCVVAGVTWYLQFFFYGMGSVKLGEKYDFSSWTLHMAFIIVFSNIWAMLFREWKSASVATRRLVACGIAVLIVSTVIIGYGNKIAEPTAEPAEESVRATEETQTAV